MDSSVLRVGWAFLLSACSREGSLCECERLHCVVSQSVQWYIQHSKDFLRKCESSRAPEEV